MMNFNEYQEECADLAIFPENGEHSIKGITYCSLALCGEAGELAK